MMRSVRPLNRLRKEDLGGALIDTALTLPILLALLFCFIEICLAVYSKNMISESAREGTRYAMYRGAGCPNTTTPSCQATAAQINAYVSGLGWPNLGGGTMTVNTTFPNGNQAPGSTVQIVVGYTMPIKLAFVPSAALSFSSTSKLRILQ